MRSCFLSFGLSWSSRTYPRWLRCGKDGCLRPFNSLPASRPAGESRPRGGTAATWTPPPLAKGKMLFCCQCLQLDFGVGLPPSKKSLQKNEYSSREDFASYLPPGWLNLAPCSRSTGTNCAHFCTTLTRAACDVRSFPTKGLERRLQTPTGNWMFWAGTRFRNPCPTSRTVPVRVGPRRAVAHPGGACIYTLVDDRWPPPRPL
jgi:hypothetical protein